jgi:hypothetical protein
MKTLVLILFCGFIAVMMAVAAINTGMSFHTYLIDTAIAIPVCLAFIVLIGSIGLLFEKISDWRAQRSVERWRNSPEIKPAYDLYDRIERREREAARRAERGD